MHGEREGERERGRGRGGERREREERERERERERKKERQRDRDRERDVAMAIERSSSCPVELESRSLSSSSSSSTKDAIVASSKVTVDLTPAHSELNSNLIEDCTTERGAAAAAETSRPVNRPVTSRSPGRTDQELPTFSTCSADRSSVVCSNEPEAVDGASVVDSITAAYSVVVHWRQNLFTIPYGQEGKSFITELTRLLRAFVDKSGLEGIALKASMVLPALVLQQPHSTSRVKDHIQCLSRRLRAWRLGLIDELVREGKTIQKCLPKRSSVDRDGDHFQRTFSNLVFAGKIPAAMRLLSEYDRRPSGKGVLDLDAPASPGSSTTARDALIEKHPPPPLQQAHIPTRSLMLTPRGPQSTYTLCILTG